MSAPQTIKIEIVKCDVLVTDQRDGSVEQPFVILVLEGERLLATRVAFAKDLAGQGGFDA